MDDVARTNELPSPREAYEPPRLDELGTVDEFTSVTDSGSALDGVTTAT
jgi:hypothetical protein